MTRTITNIENRMENAIFRFSERKVPKSVYVLLVVLYMLVTYIIHRLSMSTGFVPFGPDAKIPISVFAGAFSSIANVCVIFLVVFYDKLGYITSMIVIFMQYPMIIASIVRFKTYTSIPGLFSNLLMAIALTILLINNGKVRKYQKKLVEQATTDRLTGLPNGFGGSGFINDLVKNKEPFALVSIDINNFKSINDTVGQETGNLVLSEIGRRWREAVDSGKSGTTDFICRHSGDEFKLIIQGKNPDDKILKTIDFYKEILEQKINIENFEFHVNACYGYAVFPDDAASADSIFSYADAALYEVKRTSAIDVYALRFTTEFIRNIENNIEMEGKIREALENDTVFYYLQPQYDISHRLRGFEALARMRDADGSIISPGAFIPVAEKVGLIDNIDMCVIRKSVEFLGQMIRDYNTKISMSVNVSARHLMKKGFKDEITDIINKYQVPANQLEIELTESIMIDSADKAIECINDLKSLGIKIAIDDFGTGYSSLSYLNKFPADLLKIDKSFIDKMNSGESSVQYVAAIISLGHVMHFDVISEGVEEEEQLETLRNVGCDLIQGFIWGRPLDPDAAKQVVIESLNSPDTTCLEE